MNCFSHRFFTTALLLLAALAASNAFAPGNQQLAGLAAPSSSKFGSSVLSRFGAVVPTTALYQSSDDTINIALVSAATMASDNHDQLQTALKEHPFCKMTGIQLSIAEVPVAASTTAETWNEKHVAHLQRAEIACFENISAVKFYLQMVDEQRNVPNDTSDEDRRKLPNKLDLVGDILGGETTAAEGTSLALMAACSNASTAKECLDSGRWMANHIYYPKDTQKAVELKTEPIISGSDGGDGEEEEVEDEDIDMEVWADSIAQAAGDVMERKSWGGGW